MIFCFGVNMLQGQEKAFPYKNQNLSIDKRVEIY
jgi:beta-glucosidase